MIDDLRSGGLLDANQIVEWNHLAGVRADIVRAKIPSSSAIALVRLQVHPIRTVIEVKVVDVSRPHKDAHSYRDLIEWDADRLGLLSIDADKNLRIVRREGGLHRGELTTRRSLTNDRVRHTIDVGEGIAAGILKNELKATD